MIRKPLPTIEAFLPNEVSEAIKENKVFKIDLVEKLPTRYVALIYDKKTQKKAVSVFLKLFLDYIK